MLVSGKGRLFDHKAPYRVAIYVAERDGRFYLVKFTGLDKTKGADFKDFEKLVSSLKFSR